ncbi:hypothetical protein E8E11_008428 [Didymella keratinophila]|nr:hypothetical protein E8E11_008428 [Didymella keratinophila]
MATTVTSLDTLPEELILAILSHIPTISAVANLSLTNHRLHRLSLPPLYHTFPGRHSELFLRTISHAPSLAQHTKALVWAREPRTVSSISPLEKAGIIKRLNELCVPHGTDLAEQFERFGKSEEHWNFEILLLFCPNAKYIEVKESWLWDDHHYWFKSLSAFFNPLCSSRLNKAVIEGPMRIENIVPLLTIATLRELEVTQVTVMRREGFRVFQWSVWPVAKILNERGSGLDVLRMRESYVDLDLLVPILGGIKGLREFTYEHVPNDLADETAPAHRVNTRALTACLNMHAESLEYIRVRDTEPVNWLLIAEYLFGAPRADADAHTTFPNLKTIDIGPAGVGTRSPHQPPGSSPENIRPQVFPVSLETLRIQPAERIEFRPGSVTAHMEFLNHEAEVDHLLRAQGCYFAYEERRMKVELVEWNPTLGWFPDNLPVLQKYYLDMGMRLESVVGDVSNFYNAEPLLMDDESEQGWVVVTDLHLATK